MKAQLQCSVQAGMGENPKIKPIPELAFGVVLRAMIGVYRVRFGGGPK